MNYCDLNYPLSDLGRESSRLLFDFSVAVSCFSDTQKNIQVLDFACGTGWTSELLNKLGYDVWGFDYDEEAISFARQRVNFDSRIDQSCLHFL